MNDYELIKSMGHWDKRVLFIEMELESASARLESYIDEYRDIGSVIDRIKQVAKDDVLEYTETNKEADLARLEQSSAVLEILHQWRDDFRQDIREQRERVQWLRQELQEVKAKMERLML